MGVDARSGSDKSPLIPRAARGTGIETTIKVLPDNQRLDFGLPRASAVMTTLPQLLRESASALPDNVAVADPERGVELTYRDLHSRAEKLGEHMIRHGVRPGDRVGIYAPKSVGTVAALLGTLYSRGAYVPVDSGAPPARNAGIFADSSIRLGVVAEPLLEGLRNAWDGQSLDVLEPLGDDLVLVRGVGAEKPALLPRTQLLYRGSPDGSPARSPA